VYCTEESRSAINSIKQLSPWMMGMARKQTTFNLELCRRSWPFPLSRRRIFDLCVRKRICSVSRDGWFRLQLF